MPNDQQRWYDKKEIGKYIKAMRYLQPEERDKILLDLKNLISEKNPNIMVDHVMDFQLYRNRWYDKDPYCWLVINSLQYIDDGLMNQVLAYLNSVEWVFTLINQNRA